MSNPFKVSDKPIEVTVEYAFNDEGFLVIISNELLKKEYNGKIKKAKAEFKRENWQTFNLTLRSSIVHTVDGSIIDQAVLRDLKLRNLLTSLKYDGDNDVEINKEFFDTLDPEFAVVLTEEYDNSSVQNKELEKILLKVEESTEDEDEEKEEPSEGKENSPEEKEDPKE